MAHIQFTPGITWSTLPQAQVSMMIDRAWLLERIESLRSEWQEATGGDLSSVTVNLEMLFNDIEQLITGA